MIVKFSNPKKLLFSFSIAVLGASVGFAYMVWYYLSRVPDHLQTPFLRNQYEPSRLDGLSAAFIYGSTTLSGFIIAFIFIFWLYEKPQASGVSKLAWIMASLGYAIANAFIRKYEGMRRPADKEKFQNQAMKSYKDMLRVLKAGYNEEVELDEALPAHLKKHFDKDGNPKSKEGKAAWERLAKMKGYRKYTSKQIKMAVGIAFDKRFVQGNMTGASKAIEKIAKGLSEIEPVANALRRANENTILDRIDRKLKERR